MKWSLARNSRPLFTCSLPLFGFVWLACVDRVHEPARGLHMKHDTGRPMRGSSILVGMMQIFEEGARAGGDFLSIESTGGTAHQAGSLDSPERELECIGVIRERRSEIPVDDGPPSI